MFKEFNKIENETIKKDILTIASISYHSHHYQRREKTLYYKIFRRHKKTTPFEKLSPFKQMFWVLGVIFPLIVILTNATNNHKRTIEQLIDYINKDDTNDKKVENQGPNHTLH